MTGPTKTMVAIDGTDALAFVIIRPGRQEGGVSIEAAAKGLSKPAAAYVLRNVADQWDPRPAAEPLLSESERTFLKFALDQAAEELTLGPGFTDGDQAALASLRKLAGGDA